MRITALPMTLAQKAWPNMRDAHTLQLAQNAIDNSSITAVALQIGISRTALSLYMADKYPAEVDKLEAEIKARYDIYTCPHTSQTITGPACKQRASHPKPFGGKAKLAS